MSDLARFVSSVFDPTLIRPLKVDNIQEVKGSCVVALSAADDDTKISLSILFTSFEDEILLDCAIHREDKIERLNSFVFERNAKPGCHAHLVIDSGVLRSLMTITVPSALRETNEGRAIMAANVAAYVQDVVVDMLELKQNEEKKLHS